MLSTRAADYALRGMAYLAMQPASKLVMAAEIAAAEDMPEFFFSKIFQSLAKSGLVNSFRGSNGGFELARSPEEITMRQIVEAVDGPVAVSKCASAPESCERSGTCPFHRYWTEVQDSVLTILDSHTLAEAVSHVEAAELKHWISGDTLNGTDLPSTFDSTGTFL
ncbi:MAG: Rrf2 family transcriptional regulator [Candidatus Abyssubacteria bacterium]|nr:Rrf2 family transcriptional regulator [Candidatus Abyssubacteria bacterium]